MPLIKANGKHKTNGKVVRPLTSGYDPGPRDTYYQQPRDLPLFGFWIIRMMLMEPTIKLGLAMRAAPICSAEFAYKEDGASEWTTGIKADNPAVGEFAHKQYKRIWANEIDKLLPAQIWGWSACEAMYTQNARGEIEVGEFLSRRARDVQPLVQEGRLVGVRFLRIKGGQQPHVDIIGSKALWHAHNPEDDSHFGESICRGAFSPWADKWLQGGALDVRRLFMHKDAYGGIDLTYPDGSIYINGKGEVPNRDIARELAEQIKAGGVTTRPAVYDENGNELWQLTRASIPGNPQHILQYPKDLDVEMLRGLEIPDDVLTSETSGAWQGKQVPQQAFYTGLNRWAARLARDVKPAVQFAVDCNFGPGQTFEPELKPIDETMSVQEGSKDAGQDQGGAGSGGLGAQQWDREPGTNPQRMGVAIDPEQAVGEGVLSAAELVEAAKKVMRSRQRLSLEPAEPELHEFSSTQFNLPGELAFDVVRLGDQIHFDDLADDGREMNPHVTVKYGLHTDDPKDVRRTVSSLAPVAIQFGPVSFFTASDYDALKIEIESKALHSLNGAIADALPHTDTHPTYQPHCTIAYVKPGMGEHYAAKLNGLEGRVAVFDRLTFSDKRRNFHSIQLTGAAKFGLT